MTVRVLLVLGFLLAGRQAMAESPDSSLTVVLVGDTGMNAQRHRVDIRGVYAGARWVAWPKMTRGVTQLVNGDLNIMNLETVVTDRNDLPKTDKRQTNPIYFSSHPTAVKHLVDIGFNVASLANNHTYDYGARGVRETLAHVGKLPGLYTAGAGLTRAEAGRPALIRRRGLEVAFSSLGIVTNNIGRHRATATKPGSIAYRFDDDWRYATDRLHTTMADMRILAVHYGYERYVAADAKQMKEWRWAVRERDIDIVVGHHAHVVRGIEMRNGKVIFYGLGNFLHRGTVNMGAEPAFVLCRDYGLVARVHVKKTPGGVSVRAVEVVPIFNMHRAPHVFRDRRKSAKRVAVINYLSSQLGPSGLQFRPQTDGSGLYCVAGAERDLGKVGALCRGWRPPKAVSRVWQREIREACHKRNAKRRGR